MDRGAEDYRRYLDGDDDGLVEIIENYQDGLVLYICSVVGNVCLAEELTEEAFVRLAVKKPRFTGRSAFKTFLYAIGRHIALDNIRHRARVEAVSIEECPPLSDEEALLEQVYIRQERKIALHRALRHLPANYRQALWLVYFEELRLKEAAKIMGKSAHGMETLIYRARQSLKNQLEKEGFVYEDV